MGTTCMPKPENVKQYLDDLTTWESDTHTYRTLDSAIVAMTQYYAAVEEVNKGTGERTVRARMDLLSFSREEYGFCYKGMSEDMGPYYRKCPARILNLLTPTDNEYALEWRADCRKNLEKAATANRLQIGQKIRFSNPVQFVGGYECDTFEVTSVQRKGRNVRYLYAPSIGHVSYALAKQRTWTLA